MKYAICNELFEGQSLTQYLPLAASLGYTGLEVAPFAFDKHVAEMSAEEARAVGERIRSQGLDVVGMHWLLARTQGLHINSPDRDARDRAVAYMTRLIRRCGDMGAGIMVFGSPVQRAVLPGVSEGEAFDRAVTFFRQVAPVAQEEGVVIAIEPLARGDNNFIYTKDQGVRLIEAVGHPNVALHLDVRAMSDEGRPLPDIIREAKQYLRHFHVNDGDLGPGMGPIDFHPVLRALKEIGYDGWVSVEVFDFSLGAERIARESIEYLRRVESEMG
ncbi:MAG: sugar phosphate isomerase/epimerase family protein [Anaerolineae bacterium]